MPVCQHCGAKIEQRSIFCGSCHGYIKRHPSSRLPKRIKSDQQEQAQAAPQVDDSRKLNILERPENATPARGRYNDSGHASSSTTRKTPIEIEDAEVHFVETEEEAEIIYEPGFDPAEMGQASNEKYKLISIAAILTTILLAASIFLAISSKDITDSSSPALYSRAELLHSEQRLTEALALYQAFVDESPDHDLSALARQKIVEIEATLIGGESRLDKVQSLIESAMKAFEAGNYTAPAGDNAIAYLKRVVDLDPGNVVAKSLQAKVLRFYDNQAIASLEAGRLNSARKYYEIMLNIDPENKETSKRLDELDQAIQAYR